MDKEQKKEFKGNIIKFIIWVILLCMCRWYLQNHPAERISVFSGFEVLWQKVEVVWHNRFGSNWNLVENRYSLEKYYKELLTMAESNTCITQSELDELENTYKNLKAESNEMLETSLPEYTKQAYVYESLLQNDNCN